MKKCIFSLFFFAFFGLLQAQNVQLHYDFGNGRNYLTSTVEMFKPDKYGSTFFFVDMDYDLSNAKVKLAYFEIARDLKFWKLPIAFHTEYNGGLGQDNLSLAYQINSAFLNGVSYVWNDNTFSKGITFIAAHKYISGKNEQSFQLTAVWYLKFWKNRLLFTGFADFWKEKNNFFLNAPLGTETKFVFLTEPQLWFNVTKHFAVGTEIEIASNFALHKGFKVCPTLGLKYNFND
jgi:hypothetical protein